MEAGRTKIICTIGPASATPKVLERMIRAGMDGARLNFSHGTQKEHGEYMKRVRAAARKIGKLVTIIQDLQGPKIRVGVLPSKGVTLHKGSMVTFTSKKLAYIANGPISVTYEHFARDVQAGDRIFLADGVMELKVKRVARGLVHATVIEPGTLTSHKGVNLPDSTIGGAAFTDKDQSDLLFGVAQGVDWLVLSFVTEASVLRHARKIATVAARAAGVTPPKIMAKVERRQALEHFDEILVEADGIMLGRGDLGIEIPAAEIPEIQKDVVTRCRLAGKPVIIATHMLESMIRNPRATRAEVSDVANAVFDHTDAVMLSAESAAGLYPAATVLAMAAVIRQAEVSPYATLPIDPCEVADPITGLAHSVALLAHKNLLSAIVVPWESGLVGMLTLFRPTVPVIVPCATMDIARQANLFSGVIPVVFADHSGSSLPRLHALLSKSKRIHKGQGTAYITRGPTGITLTLLDV